MKASVVWIADGKTYFFAQWSNLEEGRESIGRMKERTAEIGEIREKLDSIAREKVGREKAEQLEPFLRSEIWPVKRFANQELGNCGPQALETIRRMMNDPAFAMERTEIARALGKAGGKEAGAELNLMLWKELRFWKGQRGSLQEGWWNGDASVSEPLRVRYATAYQLIYMLEKTGYAPAARTAREFANTWATIPPGAHESDQTVNQIVEECERLAGIVDGDEKP